MVLTTKNSRKHFFILVENKKIKNTFKNILRLSSYKKRLIIILFSEQQSFSVLIRKKV